MKQAFVVVHAFAVVPNKSSKPSATEQVAIIRRVPVTPSARMHERGGVGRLARREEAATTTKTPTLADLLTRMRRLCSFEKPYYSGAEQAAR